MTKDEKYLIISLIISFLIFAVIWTLTKSIILNLILIITGWLITTYNLGKKWYPNNKDSTDSQNKSFIPDQEFIDEFTDENEDNNIISKKSYKKNKKRIDSLFNFYIPENTSFIALDYETANTDYSSICQAGIVFFDTNKDLHSWTSLIDPESEFTNTWIHGIEDDDIIGCPKFPEFYNHVLKKLENYIVIHHTAFDRSSTNRACEKYSLPHLNIKWLDSSRIARHTWIEFKNRGYGLSDLASRFNIKYLQHDALDDAKTAGIITIKALEKSSISIENWVTKATE